MGYVIKANGDRHSGLEIVHQSPASKVLNAKNMARKLSISVLGKEFLECAANMRAREVEQVVGKTCFSSTGFLIHNGVAEIATNFKDVTVESVIRIFQLLSAIHKCVEELLIIHGTNVPSIEEQTGV